MIAATVLSAIFCVLMVLPYLPGRFDASAATFSSAVQVASYGALTLAPVGLAWIINPRRVTIWRRCTLILTGLIAFMVAMTFAFANQLSLSVMLGVGAIIFLRILYRGSQMDYTGPQRNPIPWCLMLVPLILVTFRATVFPLAATWSRDRAIQNSAALIAEIESFRQRRGHYPISLHSLNPDVPTGVVGIERFHYEPQGEAYNVFFVRPHVELDAQEVVLFNPRDEHRFTSHELDILQYDGEHLDLRRGDRRRTKLAHAHWISILFD